MAGNAKSLFADCDREVIEKKVVGDTGFEPVTSTVCKKHKKKGKRKI
jgi:hypothetical protein